MKKLVLAFVAVAAISFASCGNTQKPAQNAGDSIQKDSIPTDTDTISKVVEEAPVKGDTTNNAK